NDHACLNMYDNRSSRLSDCERKAQQTMLLIDAPFIYTKISMKVCCNRQITVDVSRTAFPQTRLYINGKKVDEKDQKDLGGLVAAEGQAMTFLDLSAVGHGNFAPLGDNLHWNAIWSLCCGQTNGYTEEARNAARCCSFKIILTDVENIVEDIENFCCNLKEVESREGVFLKEFKEKANKNQMVLDKLRKSNIRMSKRLDKYENDEKERANDLKRLVNQFYL
ncbi:15086_t:CDS:2, partial [Gigaspora margarita]